MYKIFYYTTNGGKNILQDWLIKLKNRRAANKIISRLYRLEEGNLGDYKSLGKGLYELRIREGKGYRVYYTLEGKEIILLLCGGDKSTQSKDIKQAHEYLEDHKRR